MQAINISSNANGYRAILEQKLAKGQGAAAHVIETINRDMPKDVIAATKALEFHVNEDPQTAKAMGLRVQVGEHTLWPSDYALGQIATRGNVPTAYLRELAAGAPWQRQLAAHALKESFSNGAKERVLVRSVKGQLRGMLSDKYRRLDSRPLVDALASEAQAVGALPADGVATETRVAIKLLMPEIIEPVPGEYMVYGAEWSNSDYGNGTHSFRAFALRVVCLNGATSENVMKQIHLGAKLHDDIEFSERTYRLDTQTSVSALRDVVRGTLGPRGRERMTASIVKANEAKYTKAQLAAHVRGFTKEVQKSVVDAFDSPDVVNLPAGDTQWRASNAMSWVARNTKDDELRLDLERAAGTVLA
jgi:hypothetical protein